MKIGVYVGSFNPVHKGHKNIMDHLLDNNYLDKIIVIPTGNYWNKKDLINVKHRINMLKFYESNKIYVNSTLNNIKYTYEILNEVKKMYKKDEIYLIIGADNLSKFHLWKKVEDLLQYKIIVMKRSKINLDKHLTNFKDKNNFIIIEDFQEINISSTDIRENIENNKDKLDKEIYEYIKNNDLYK